MMRPGCWKLEYLSEADPHEDVLPAVRQYPSVYPSATTHEPGQTARNLRVRSFMEREPSEAEVEAALEALRVEGEALA